MELSEFSRVLESAVGAREAMIAFVHCEITYRRDGRIEVRDRSNNGTWLRGARIHGAVTAELGTRPIEIAPVEGQLGTLVVRRS